MKATHEPGLDAKVAFLRLASSYPEQTCRVEARETHMSWVFLLDAFVYKLKKPVESDCLDYRSLAARQYFCNEELRLNRRLAPDVYLDVVSLNLDHNGHLSVGGKGQSVDWLVRMRRLPGERMLDAMIERGALHEEHIRQVVEKLFAFYRQLPAERPEPQEYRDRLRRRIEASAQGLSSPLYGLPASVVQAIATAQLRALSCLRATLDERASGGHIVEAHGDLRPEHVCITSEVSIIDCLEFSRNLRVMDVADEIAFLSLECERLGAPGLASSILAWFSRLSGDNPSPALVNFYKSLRSTSRAHVAIRHLQGPHPSRSAHWQLRALEYLQLANLHIDRSATTGCCTCRRVN
jgi:aminoglycoside phosphotransferase family enzyme